MQNIDTPLEAIERGIGGDNLSWLQALRQRALNEALPVYLVGGTVRDVLLGASVKDLDFVVEGDAPEVARQLAAVSGGKVVAHPRFGTATVSRGRLRIDLVTARRETYLQPGALPQVTPGSIYDDLARRDFSINAMALPLSESRPRVLDLHGGIEDAGSGVIRALHGGSFVDDPTRILRALRYEQRFGFSLEGETASRLKEAVDRGCLATVSGDRLRHELERILGEDRPAPALQRAVDLGVLAAIYPPFGDCPGLPALFAPASGQPAPDLPDEPLAFLAALAYHLSEVEGEGLVRRLNLSHDWAKVVQHTIQLRQLEPELAQALLSPSQVFHRLGGWSTAAAVAVSGMTSAALVSQRLTQFLHEWRWVVPELNGRDLLALGVPDGPLVGQILRELRDAKLEGQVVNQDDERDLVSQILARLEH